MSEIPSSPAPLRGPVRAVPTRPPLDAAAEREVLRRYLDQLHARPAPEDWRARRRLRAEIQQIESAIEWHDLQGERRTFARRAVMWPVVAVIWLPNAWSVLAGDRTHTVLGTILHLGVLGLAAMATGYGVGRLTCHVLDVNRRKVIERVLSASEAEAAPKP